MRGAALILTPACLTLASGSCLTEEPFQMIIDPIHVGAIGSETKGDQRDRDPFRLLDRTNVQLEVQ